MTIPADSAGSSASYKLSAEVLDSGGTKGTSASYQLIGKSRGHGLALPASASFTIGEGFLRGVYFGRVVFAPIVTAIVPSSANNNRTVLIEITGANFATGAAVKLSLAGEADIVASNVVVASTGRITGELDLRGVRTGLWGVTVTNLDGRSGTLPAAFRISLAAPTVRSIAPVRGINDRVANITDLAGADFRSGASVKLAMTGASDIAATEVVVSSASKITCRLDLAGKPIGIWDVVVTNDDGSSGTLAAAFKVESPVLEIVKQVASDRNPFDPKAGATIISYTLSKDVNMTVYIFNMRGEKVWEYRAPAGSQGGQVGENRVLWDGVTAFQEHASAGVYLVHVTSVVNGSLKTLSKTKIAVTR